MSLISAGLCDIGKKRKTNQDAIYLNPQKKLFIVADGMGGHQGGDVASAMAVKYIPEYFLTKEMKNPVTDLKAAIMAANLKISEKSEEDKKFTGMGTTVVSLFFKGPSLYISNVGDSRAYLVNRHKIYQLSKDHSMVQEKINIGIYTREQASADSQKNVLTRSLGPENDLEIDIFQYQVCKNDLFILCSDGMHGKINDEDLIYLINREIPHIEKAKVKDLKKTAQRIVALANKNGGDDNISVILVLAQ
ncbi:MAG: Stp1/IreP family PP2C-type Ser/Thr phosphatase [Halobacteriovoraceae bacterium]|nr:Stp1/IreP family PP2C-type Ser/Thr phosphatase [Halobacteriovoraceae bacterium]